MHRLALLLATLWLLPAAAVAQEWTEYRYPDAGFAVQFPSAPIIARGTYTTPAGLALPMLRYAVTQPKITYTVQVVDYSQTSTASSSAIAATEQSFDAAGKVTVAIDARINRQYGRELSVSGTDGSRSVIAIFFFDRHLYLLVARALPPDAVAKSGDAVRFQQSLQFVR